MMTPDEIVWLVAMLLIFIGATVVSALAEFVEDKLDKKQRKVKHE